MIDLMSYPSMIRNVMVGGHIHHGKTSLLDMLVFETHQLTWDADKQASHLPSGSDHPIPRRASR
jgi:U5 small nuclear ribonucleoprotein component